MTVLKLGGIDLNPNMTVPQLNAADKVAQTNIPTIGGGVLVFQQVLKAGTPVQLIATEDQGWIEKDSRDALLIEAAKVGFVLTLEVGGQTFNVMFDHSDGAAVELTPLINRLVPLDGDVFIGVINLVTV